MAADALFCLFQCNSRNYAAMVDLVAGVLDPPALVRVGSCPPMVLGLCPFRRDVIPVVEFGAQSGPRRQNLVGEDAVGNTSEQSVLIVQAARGAWGIRVDRSRTRIAAERPSRHEPKPTEDGAVVEGIIRNGATEYLLLDVDATWQAIRSRIVDGYARLGAPAAQA